MRSNWVMPMATALPPVEGGALEASGLVRACRVRYIHTPTIVSVLWCSVVFVIRTAGQITSRIIIHKTTCRIVCDLQ